MTWFSRLIVENGLPRAHLRPGDGEFVCADCDGIFAAANRPLACAGCGKLGLAP